MRQIYFLIIMALAAFAAGAHEAPDTVPKPNPPAEVYTLAQARQLGMVPKGPATSSKATAGKAEAAAGTATKAYGFGLKGYVSLSLSAPSKTTVEFDYSYNFSAGAKAGAYIYLVEYTIDKNGSMHPTYLVKSDVGKRTYSRVAALDYNGPNVQDMAYSESTGTMYCLGSHYVSEGGITVAKQALYTIDLASGKMTMVGDDLSSKFMSLAANRAGLLYAVEKTGQLSTIDPITGYVAKVGSSVLTKTANYISGMDMDCDNNQLYWPLCDSNGYSYLVKIDPSSGAGKVIGRIGTSEEELVGFNVERYQPGDDAPAKVAGLTFTPGASGALSGEAQWTNPSATVGGSALKSISKAEVYLNGNLYKEVAVTPGAKSTVQLDGLANSYNRVAVVAYNGESKSETAEAMSWVGPDVPQAVTGITLERITPHLATLKWEAPAGAGLHNGYVKTSSLKYRITRYNAFGDTTVVAKTYRKDRTYLDSTITTLASYKYSIQALTSDYGGTAFSPEVQLGPANEVPYSCVFQSEAVFKLWTLYDNNNDGKCWTCYPYKHYVYHVPAGVKADDWMISPPVHMKADSTYYVYFEFRSGLGEYYPKHIQVTVGKSNDYRDHKVIKDYKFASRITEQARIALPISEDGEYYVGIRDVSDYTSCNVSLYNFCIVAKHTGWLKGQVRDEAGNPVEGVTVNIPGSNICDTTDTGGNYMLDFVPTGSYPVKYSKLYWRDLTDTVAFVNDKESTHNVTLSKLPAYSVTGQVKDVNGKCVANAKVKLTGYGEDRETVTGADGKFAFSSIAEHGYKFTLSKIKYAGVSDTIVIAADTTISITLNPKILAPSEFKVTATDDAVNLAWSLPRDVFRHDNGAFESQLGWLGGNDNSVYGAVFRTPAVLKSISWVTTSYQGPHDEMNLWIFDVTDDFKPTNKVLFNAMHVATKGDEVWNTYELPQPVEAPNGYFLGVSYSKGMCSLATDSGTDPEYPFVPYTNYSTQDYTTNKWHCADASFVKRNHLIRATGDELGSNPQNFDYKYVVWRMAEDDFLDSAKWVMLTPADGTAELKLSDNVATLKPGDYIYALAAVYPGGKCSEILYSDNVTVKESGIEAMQLASHFIVAPNPASTVVKVNMDCDKMELYNVDGALCAAATGTRELNVEQLASGVYLLKATISGRTVIKRVIVKN